MNQYESELNSQLDLLEQLLNSSRELEEQMQARPNQARVLLDEWAAVHQPTFQTGYESALSCLGGGTLEPIPKQKPVTVLAWTPQAVRADTEYRLVRDHRSKIGPVYAEFLGERAGKIKKAWDDRMETLLKLARQLTQPPTPAAALLFQERCQAQLAQLAHQKEQLNAGDFEIRSRLVLSDLKKELGQLPLSWEQKQSLRNSIDAFGSGC